MAELLNVTDGQLISPTLSSVSRIPSFTSCMFLIPGGYVNFVVYVCCLFAGGLFYAWNANMVATLVIMLLITIGYLLVCLYGSQELQLKVGSSNG